MGRSIWDWDLGVSGERRWIVMRSRAVGEGCVGRLWRGVAGRWKDGCDEKGLAMQG